MFFGTKLIEYQASFYDLLNLWCFYSITAPHYANHSILQEQERLRKEALLVAERERHARYRRQDEEREVVRQRIREKVDTVTYTDAKCNTPICVKYNIEKPATEDDEEEDEDDFAFGQKRLEDNQDSISSEN